MIGFIGLEMLPAPGVAINGSGTINGVKIKSMRDRGSYIEDVVVQNMAVSNVGEG